MKHLAISLAMCAAACATSDGDLDDQAIAEGGDDKTDSISFTRLERATPAEVAKAFVARRGTELTECFAAYLDHVDASATQVTKEVADDFIDVAVATRRRACGDWYDLKQIVYGVLDAQSRTGATVAELIVGMAPWSTSQLTAASVGGYVQEIDVPLLILPDLWRVQDDNAMAREQHPTGIDLQAIRAAWAEVRKRSTLDRAYLNPVTYPSGSLDGRYLFSSLRAAFPLRGLTLVSTGHGAIDDFAAASEGPDNDPAFAPIRTALRKASIKKRFYFAYSGRWSSHVLIVIDQHGQAWGMQMGYSE